MKRFGILFIAELGSDRTGDLFSGVTIPTSDRPNSVRGLVRDTERHHLQGHHLRIQAKLLGTQCFQGPISVLRRLKSYRKV
jgi:hypothetical protein